MKTKKYMIINYFLHSVQFSRSVVSDSLRPRESQHARPPYPSPTHGVHSNSCPSSQWCHPAISSSLVPFSSCPQSLPASESFPMSQKSSIYSKSPAWGTLSLELTYSLYCGEDGGYNVKFPQNAMKKKTKKVFWGNSCSPILGWSTQKFGESWNKRFGFAFLGVTWKDCIVLKEGQVQHNVLSKNGFWMGQEKWLREVVR